MEVSGTGVPAAGAGGLRGGAVTAEPGGRGPFEVLPGRDSNRRAAARTYPRAASTPDDGPGAVGCPPPAGFSHAAPGTVRPGSGPDGTPDAGRRAR